MSGRMDRRAFLGALPAAALAMRGLDGPAGALAPRGLDGLALQGAKPRLDAIGVQVYTLRAEMADDTDRALAAIAEIGYTEVELFGDYALAGREMRNKLDAVGLRCASSHVSIETVRDDWDATLESAQELGQALIVVSSLPNNVRGTEGLVRVGEEFNEAGAAARAAGLRFGYHNHDWEFAPLAGGVLPIEVLLESTDPELVDWQMDIFWTVKGAGDPYALIEAYSGRVTSVHVKDRTPSGDMADVGAGVIDFRRILGRAEELGLLHQFVEHDFPADAIESVRASFAGLQRLIG